MRPMLFPSVRTTVPASSAQPPMVQRTVPISLHFRIDRPLHEGVLFVPQTMEEKWAIFYRQQKIICVRSWTRKVAIVAHVRTHKDTLEIHQVDGSFSDEYETPAFTARMLDFLLRSHVQEAPFPTPLPDFLAYEPARAAAWCFLELRQPRILCHRRSTGTIDGDQIAEQLFAASHRGRQNRP